MSSLREGESLDRSDARLVSGALRGDPGAFDEIVRKRRPALVQLARRMVKDVDEAESLAQEALTRAYSQLASFVLGAELMPWLRGITLNVCRRHLRERMRHARLDGTGKLRGVPAARGAGTLSGVLRRESSELANGAFEELPAALREAFQLCCLVEMSYDDASRIVGVSLGAVRVRVHRARALLRDRLGSVVDTRLRNSRESKKSS